MLRYRLMLGPVLILLLVGGIWLDQVVDDWPTPGFVRGLPLVKGTFPPGTVIFLGGLTVLLLAARELATILRDKGIAASRRVMCAASLTGLLVAGLVPEAMDGVRAVAVVGSAAAGVLLGSLAFYSRRKSFEGVVAGAGGALLAFVYLGLMFGFILAIRREHSAWVILWILLVTKSCDIGAFATGMTVGRHKLIPWLSPGKTWEGLAGGVLTSAAIGSGGVWLLERCGEPGLGGVWMGALAGGLFGVVGQGGDLIASLFKRDAGIKDSGRLLPGFGGMLDVVDSPLLVAPVAFWWLVLMGSLGGG